MPDRIGDLCVLSTAGTIAYENRESLSENILSAAAFFGFSSLPDELKIKIHICSEEEFKQKKEELNIDVPDFVIAFTCKINNIFILEYRNINRWYSLNAYNAVIVHECIHAFQTYFSMIPPKQYVWLYESVACYLAKQKKHIIEKIRFYGRLLQTIFTRLMTAIVWHITLGEKYSNNLVMTY